MRSLLLAVALVATPLLAACDSAGPAVKPTPVVIPLAVGTEWVLNRVSAEDVGDAPGPRPTGGTDTLTVTRDTVVAGERSYRIEASRGLAHCVFGGAGWYANRPEGLVRWTDDPADAELVYALGTPTGEPFLDTPTFLAVIADPDATYRLGSERVPTVQYERTWRRIELNDEVRGPIAPAFPITDHLSPTLGPVSLQVGYVVRGDGDTFTPRSRITHELAPTLVY